MHVVCIFFALDERPMEMGELSKSKQTPPLDTMQIFIPILPRQGLFSPPPGAHLWGAGLALFFSAAIIQIARAPRTPIEYVSVPRARQAQVSCPSWLREPVQELDERRQVVQKLLAPPSGSPGQD